MSGESLAALLTIYAFVALAVASNHWIDNKPALRAFSIGVLWPLIVVRALSVEAYRILMGR